MKAAFAAAQQSIHISKIRKESYEPKLRGDDITMKDLMMCIPQLQRAGALWPRVFFTMCRLIQSDPDTEQTDIGTVLELGVNILRMVEGIRSRIHLLVQRKRGADVFQLQVGQDDLPVVFLIFSHHLVWTQLCRYCYTSLDRSRRFVPPSRCFR